MKTLPRSPHHRGRIRDSAAQQRHRARIVEALRQAGVLAISLVRHGRRPHRRPRRLLAVQIDGVLARWYGLVVLVTNRQASQGIGGALIREDLARHAAMNANGWSARRSALTAAPASSAVPTLTYGGTPSQYFQRVVPKGEPRRGTWDIVRHRRRVIWRRCGDFISMTTPVVMTTCIQSPAASAEVIVRGEDAFADLRPSEVVPGKIFEAIFIGLVLWFA